MVIDPTPNRRTVLKALGAIGAVGSVGTASAESSGKGIDDLRLFGEEAAESAFEVVTQGNYAYVANGSGMAVIDWSEPGDPKLVADVAASDPENGHIGGALDVKVEGDVAVLAHNHGTGITTYDVSDPENPEELAFYETEDEVGVHNCFVYDGHAYLTVNTHRPTDNGVRIFGNAGVEIVDLSDPANPEQASLWRLREAFESFANAGTNPNHDVYVQDDLLYNAFWNAGIVVHDVSDPTDPEVVGHFGDAPLADEEIPPTGDEDFDFPLARYYAGDGNAHYVRPTPDGEHTLVGDEKFPGALEDNPPAEKFGGIRIFDTRDFDSVEQVGYISPPEGDRLRTAHNSPPPQGRLYSGWYHGGVRVFDITDPSNPDELARYRPDGIAFWTAVYDRSFTIGGVYGARSDSSDGGIAVLHDDNGEKRPPAFEGSTPPQSPGIGRKPDEE